MNINLSGGTGLGSGVTNMRFHENFAIFSLTSYSPFKYPIF